MLSLILSSAEAPAGIVAGLGGGSYRQGTSPLPLRFSRKLTRSPGFVSETLIGFREAGLYGMSNAATYVISHRFAEKVKSGTKPAAFDRWADVIQLGSGPCQCSKVDRISPQQAALSD